MNGGTLKAGIPDSPDHLDPGLSYTNEGWEIFEATNDGLLTYRRIGGPATNRAGVGVPHPFDDEQGGRPVVELPDMPDVAGNAFPIVFGDFGNGYRIFDRVALSILRDPYSQATVGMTRFHGRRRVAGGVGKAEALRKAPAFVY